MEWNIFILPLTLIFTELAKRTMKPESKLLPWIAVSLGAILGLIYGLIESTNPAGLMRYIVEGIIYGASASGIYDVSASALKSQNWESSK